MTRAHLWRLAMALWVVASVGLGLSLCLGRVEPRPSRELARDISPSPGAVRPLPRPFAVTPEDFRAEASP